MSDKVNAKICFFNTAKTWGGGEKWHFEMASAIQNRNFDVECVAFPESAFQEKLKKESICYKTFSIGNLSFLNPLKLYKLYRYFKKGKFDYLIMNLPSDIKAAGMAAKWAGIPHIIYRRGSAIPIRNSYLNRIIFQRILSSIIANSEATKKTINFHNPKLFDESKIKVIYNGLHLPEKKAINENPSIKPNQKVRIGHLGRMVPQKGHEMLLQIAKKLKEKAVNFELILGGDGSLEEEIRKSVVDMGLQDEVQFEGFVSDVPTFMNSIDIFVLSSRWEGFGFVLAEAMAAAKPIVAFNISSNPELVLHQKNGLLVEAFNLDEFTLAVEKLINNPSLRTDYGLYGYHYVYQYFTFEKSIELFFNYLLNLRS